MKYLIPFRGIKLKGHAMKKLLAAVTCLLTLVLLPLTAAAEANVLHAPEEFYGACSNLVENFDGPLVAYSISKPKTDKKNPNIVSFSIDKMRVNFLVMFLSDLTQSHQKKILEEHENLFAVFTKPGALVPAADAKSALDFLLVYHAYNPSIDEYVCLPVTYANLLSADIKRHLSKYLQKLMEMKNVAYSTSPSASPVAADGIDYRSSTAESMKAACGEDFVNGLPQSAIGYRVTGTVETIGTGRQFFTIEGGAEGVNYDVAVPKNPGAALLLKPFANSKDPSETAVFAVFGPSNVKGNNVSITLYAFDKYNPRGCFMLTPPESVFLLPQHLPPQVNKMLTATH